MSTNSSVLCYCQLLGILLLLSYMRDYSRLFWCDIHTQLFYVPCGMSNESRLILLAAVDHVRCMRLTNWAE